MGCFTNQISSEWLDIVIVSMRWAVNFFLNLKVIKGSSSYAIREIFHVVTSSYSLREIVMSSYSLREIVTSVFPKLFEAFCSFFSFFNLRQFIQRNTNRYVPFVLE